MTNKKIIPVEKRGGMRKVLRKRPNKKSNPSEYFKEKKSFLDKKLTQHRFIISSDFTGDDMLFLTLFTAWVKANEKFFDDRNHFPIYGFVTGNTSNNKVRAQRIREFLNNFADILAWNDKEHHLYNGYLSAGNRIWFDGPQSESAEETLLINKDVINNPDYPPCQSLESGLSELKGLKASNIFFINLRELYCNAEGFTTFLKQCNGVTTTSICNDKFITVSPLSVYLSSENAKNFFNELEEETEWNKMVKDTMFFFNDRQINDFSKKMSETAFKQVDWDDYQSFKKVCQENDSLVKEHQSTITSLDEIIKNNSNVFNVTSAQVMLRLLKLAGTIEKESLSTLDKVLDVAINLI